MDANRTRLPRRLAVVAVLTLPLLAGCHFAHGGSYAPSYGLYNSPGYSYGHGRGRGHGHHRRHHRSYHY